MKKIIILSTVALIMLVAAVMYSVSVRSVSPVVIVPAPESTLVQTPLAATYLIDEESFTLTNGTAEKEIMLGAATVHTVTVFGEPVYGDVDGDGDRDAVLLLVSNPGGSGSFYYAALAVNVDGSYRGTDTILLGDRIAPQNWSIVGTQAEINYVTRLPEDTMVVQPSVGKTLRIMYDPVTFRLIQVASDFEGEANPAMMTLDMQPWTWQQTEYANDVTEVPENPEAFTLTFTNDGAVAVQTDCNTMSGSYTIDGSTLQFGEMAMTMMYCEDSQGQVFAQALSQVQSFFFTSKGELVLELLQDSGSMTFR